MVLLMLYVSLRNLIGFYSYPERQVYTYIYVSKDSAMVGSHIRRSIQQAYCMRNILMAYWTTQYKLVQA